MVKGIHIKWTPWRSRTELLRVRGCLYPSLHYRGGSAGGDGGGEGYDMRWEVGDGEGMDGGEQDQVQDRDRDRRRWACDLITAWKLRANLPHAIESTWNLTEAILTDEQSRQKPFITTKNKDCISIYAIKAGYVVAISRFVTGLVDNEQSAKYKISMYTLASQIGLPASFVDLRHEAAHGEMPGLEVLRREAERALRWLWDGYWKDLGSVEEEDGAADKVSRYRSLWYGEVATGEQENLGGSESREEMMAQEDDEEINARELEWKGLWRRTPIGVVP